MSVGRSHSILGKSTEALALFSHAFELVGSATSQSAVDSEGPPRLDVSKPQVSALETTLRGLVAQHRGLVTLERFDAASGAANERPLVERLQQFTTEPDMSNLVPYPPQMQPVPVKPLFFDVAWNYINYPRIGNNQAEEAPVVEEKKSRGWFGFGRS